MTSCDDQVSRGRDLILSGRDVSTFGMGEYAATKKFFECQRQQVEEGGMCEGACGDDELRTTRNGSVVCRRTFQECPLRRWINEFQSWCDDGCPLE